MSLEQEIIKLREAVEANTAALLGGESKPASKPAAGKATASKPAARSSKKKDVVDLGEHYGPFLSSGTKAEKAKAKANVKAMLEHFGVDRISEIEGDDIEAAMDWLEKFKEGEDFEADDGGEEDDDGLM